MTTLVHLLDEWARFDEAASGAECRLGHVLDDYCEAKGPAPSPAEVACAKRLRFIAQHRLRWILYQVDKARADASLI